MLRSVVLRKCRGSVYVALNIQYAGHPDMELCANISVFNITAEQSSVVFSRPQRGFTAGVEQNDTGQ